MKNSINFVPDISAMHADALMTRIQLAAISGFALQTLKMWPAQGKGPRITVVEGRPRYRVADVRQWMGASVGPEEGIDRGGYDSVPVDTAGPAAARASRAGPSRPFPTVRPDDTWEDAPHSDFVPFGKCKPAQVSLRALRVAGVYFLCSGTRICYVGQSLSVLPRVCEHVKTYGDKITDAYVLRARIDELDDLEGFYIKSLRPEWNGNPGPFSKLISRSASANRLLAGKMRSQTDMWRRIPA